MPQKTKLLWTSVPQHVREIVEKLAASQGITIAEYLRKLVIEDLDKRSFFTAMLKNKAAQRPAALSQRGERT
ncbi:MAG: hypothetical protein QXK89_10175 [Candidatus Bathyarchaeia archaeon]